MNISIHILYAGKKTLIYVAIDKNKYFFSISYKMFLDFLFEYVIINLDKTKIRGF